MFEPHFPEIDIALFDGLVRIVPRPESAYVIRHPQHVTTVGDRQRSGFRRGDVVTVQGKWQSDQAGLPTLTDATGIMGMDKAALLSDWQRAIRNVTWVSRLAGLLSVLGMAMLILHILQRRARARAEETQTWMHQITNKDVPETSLSSW